MAPVSPGLAPLALRVSPPYGLKNRDAAVPGALQHYPALQTLATRNTRPDAPPASLHDPGASLQHPPRSKGQPPAALGHPPAPRQHPQVFNVFPPASLPQLGAREATQEGSRVLTRRLKQRSPASLQQLASSLQQLETALQRVQRAFQQVETSLQQVERPAQHDETPAQQVETSKQHPESLRVVAKSSRLVALSLRVVAEGAQDVPSLPAESPASSRGEATVPAAALVPPRVVPPAPANVLRHLRGGPESPVEGRETGTRRLTRSVTRLLC